MQLSVFAKSPENAVRMFFIFNLFALLLTCIKDATWVAVFGWVAFLIASAAQWWPDRTIGKRRLLERLAVRALYYGICGLLLGLVGAGMSQNAFSAGVRLCLLAIASHTLIAGLVFLIGRRT